ncbi:MAG TPA: hypothetical protein VFA95_15590 [Gammaproteobacteria bacterium]|nr:hypothetical protein [Gammaproteobacteria bacterium]
MASRLDTFDKGDFSLAQILDELHQAHRQSLSDIAMLMGVSTNALYRVRRGRTAAMEVAPLVRLCCAYGLPCAPIYYQNALSPLNPSQRAALRLPETAELFDSDGRARAVRIAGGSHHDSDKRAAPVTVLFDVLLAASDFPRFAQADLRERARILGDASLSREVRSPGWRPLDGRIYVDMQGNHMLDRFRKAPNIPPGAVVEIEPFRPGEPPANGEIVFAQVDETPATCYLYRGFHQAGEEREEFGGLPADEPSRTIGDAGLDLDRQRVLIGRPTRIVDYPLQRSG